MGTNMNGMKQKQVSKQGSDVPVITNPRIDKLGGTIVLEDAALCKNAWNGMVAWSKHQELGVKPVKSHSLGNLAVVVHYPDNEGLIHFKGPTLYLEVSHWTCKERRFRFEYNPARMTDKGEDHLEGMIMELLGVGFYEIMHHAVFNRMDVCRDIMDRSIMDYLIENKWSKSSQSHVTTHYNFDGAQGVLETLTFNKSKNNQVTAYNKGTQLYGHESELQTLRIEAKLRPNKSYAELKAIKDPFTRTRLYSLYAKASKFEIGYWRAIQDSFRLRGIGNAIKNQPVAERSKLKAAVSKHPVPWWSISESDWPKYMAEAIVEARLDKIPHDAPPLSFQFHIGQAA